MSHLRDSRADAAKKDWVLFPETASGARVPEILKNRERGFGVERPPPYVPEAHPIELARNCL